MNADSGVSMLFDQFWGQEFEDLELCDERINKRLISLLCSLGNNPGESINSSCREKKSAKGAYRLLDNEGFFVEEVMKVHCEKTAERSSSFKNVILIQDTTTFNYDDESRKDLGRIGGHCGHAKSEVKGIHCHNLLAFSEAGEPLGVLHQYLWVREGKSKGRKKYREMPFSEKESYRWSESVNKSLSFMSPEKTNFIIISDRESHINAYMGSVIDMGLDFIVRANGRRRDISTQESLEKIFSKLESRGETIVESEYREKKETARRNPEKVRLSRAHQSITLEIKYTEMVAEVESIDEVKCERLLTAILVKEAKTARNLKPIEWILLTTMRVACYEDALKVIELYKSRWRIEVFHKAQKSACRLEKCELRKKDRLYRMISIKSLVAFSICRMKYLLTACPEDPSEKYFAKEVVDVLKSTSLSPKIRSQKEITVQDFVFMLANIKGYKTNDPRKPPGVIVLSKAIEAFNLVLWGYEAALKSKDVGKR